MKHWECDLDDGNESISLVTSDGKAARVMNLTLMPDGAVRFLEECDRAFEVQMSVDDAKAALREALAWLEGR